MPEFEIRSFPQQHTAATVLTVPMTEIGDAMSKAFPAVFHAVTEAGATPVGPPLTRYFTFGEPTVEFECAIPVAAPFAGHGEIKASSVGGGDAAVCMHVGPYDTIGKTWEALMAWVSEQGRTPGGAGWESYLTDPGDEPDPEKWVTEVCMPLA
jgi:effector-binding domain-containing protein